MSAPRRQQLVWLNADAWQSVTTRPTATTACGACALECLEYWAQSDLPLVVTRQPVRRSARHADETLTLGLPAPVQWDRRRLFVEVPAGAVRRIGSFPSAEAIAEQLPAGVQGNWRILCRALQLLQVAAQVYGSYGWQWLTGLPYRHEQSDIDLLIVLDNARQADAATELLQSASDIAPRIDGELLFNDGAAVPWREWAAWRAGRIGRVLVKRQHAAALEDPRSWAVA